ncbi:uncharacterized protein LOC133799506 [Humulus lupulus]|uniref:uncharacterized protein LOC133799506 n=1 Tax=Humulus lupulus TaxID=3486 RepID=UPI002B40ACC7|nr:uncharacterized protein LOC133799506 [Humulus lupulus]
MARRRKVVQKLVQAVPCQELPSSIELQSEAPSTEPVCEKREDEAVPSVTQEFPDKAKEVVSPKAPILSKDRSSSWAEEGGSKLEFTEPLQKDGQKIAQLDIEEIEVEASLWNSALIYVVMGANPPLSVFEGFINRIWGKFGIERVARMNSGFTMVKFRDEATRDMILESGVIHFDRKPVILRPWTTDIENLKSIKSVPVWIRLPDLGLQYWGTKCLSALFINYINERGQVMDQLIDYEWLPTKCSNCKKLGHTASSCKQLEGLVWRKKEVPADIAENNTKTAASGSKNNNETNVSGQAVTVVDSHSQSGELQKEKDWTTPKKLGTMKVKSPDIGQNTKNAFSVLQEQQQFLHDPSPLLNLNGQFQLNELERDRVEEVMNSSFVNLEFYSSKALEGQSFCFTVVYGLNQIELRKSLWSALASISLPVKPWLVLGDFNSVFEVEERIGGKVISPKEVEDARKWLDLGIVEEMKFLGSYYTWSNNQDGNNRIFSKLDRVFINEDWIDMFPNVNAIASWEILRKLHRLQFVLKRFNWKVVGDIVKEYEESKVLFQQAKNKLFSDPKSQILSDIERASHLDFKKKEAAYASFLYQQSKVDWLRFGDENSSLFYSSMKKRKVKLVQQLGCYVQYKAIKSPGLDGFGAGFYKSLWSIIGKEVASAVIEFFDLGHIPKRLNSTILALIPKVTQPSNASEYRPITCCNTLYKCISKMLCNRLIPILPKVVNQNQGAFVKNRSIAHNILILQDLLKGYNRKRVSPRCLMKIDLSKAYDSIDWNFLESLLNAYKFPGRFIKWVMVCLRGSSYSILMNDQLYGDFKGGKGLRQGDPISPLLFVLVMGYLTRALHGAAKDKHFRFHPLCKTLNITNLCFADDLLLMCKAHLSSIQIMQQAFKAFSSASVLSINHAKSSIYFGGITSAEKEKLLCISNLREGHFPLKYLGVPLRPTKWKAMDCDIIISKIRQRLHGWASRNLSYAGRVQLIQSVLLGIRTFG